MRVLLRILSYLKPYWKWLTIGYIALVLSISMQLAIPRLIEYVIDNGIATGNERLLAIGVISIVGVGILQGAFTFGRSYVFQFLAERASYDVRNEFYQHMQRLAFSFFDRSHTGQLMSRATEDINSIRRFLMFSMRSLAQSAVMLVLISILLFTINWELALLALSVMPILIYSAIHFGRTIRPIYLGIQQQFGVMTNRLQENLAGARVVRAFAKEDDEIDQFEAELTGLYDRHMTAIKKSATYFPFMTLLSTASLSIILWYGGRQVLSGSLTIGQLTAFYFYLAMLGMPVRMLGFTVNSLARALASGQRIFEILDAKPAIRSKRNAMKLDAPSGHVEFDNVSFKYANSDEWALRDISFVAEPNQRVALIGGTGSGKSSVTALIPRFYDVTEGVVRIDGHDVRDLDLASLRQHVGLVLQDTFLFSVTIRENIAYGRPSATDEEVVAAAKAAKAHDFILEMPEGYDTVVGERGVSLSGGQKQRISIARGIVMSPSILILDDATSNVDTETEFEIQHALQQLMQDRTTFVIAHRLLTLKTADLILVLENGQITERGTHKELLENGGTYARIYDLQLKDQEELASVAD